ncbi:IS1380 family transposase, partial [Pseudomonas aeruginosa]|nr:IS1380 family transposase [Pseudomonas aeruginosa]
MRASQRLDRLSITADEDTLIDDAGLLLPATLAQRLGLPELLDARITTGAHPAEKCLTVIHSALAGGDC